MVGADWEDMIGRYGEETPQEVALSSLVVGVVY